MLSAQKFIINVLNVLYLPLVHMRSWNVASFEIFPGVYYISRFTSLPGSPSIDNGALGTEKLLLNTHVSEDSA